MLRILIPLVLGWLAWLLTFPPRPSAWVVVVSGVPLVVLGSWLAHRSSDESWRSWALRTFDIHALIAVLLVALGLQFEDAHGVTTDGVIYFSQLRSVIFDRDLDVAAEFAFLGQPPRPYHVVPIGPTFVWLPLYLAVAAVDAVGRWLGAWSVPADAAGLGLTLPYVRAALVSSFAVGALGLFVLHRQLRQEFSRSVSLAATLLFLGATPLVWYMVYEPSMTHAVSFGFVALFVVAAARTTSVTISPRQSITLGALLGAAFLSRPQEALFALFPAVVLLASPARSGTATSRGASPGGDGRLSGACRFSWPGRSFLDPHESRALSARRRRRLPGFFQFALGRHVVVVVARLLVVVAGCLCRASRHSRRILRDRRGLGDRDPPHRAGDGVDQRVDGGLGGGVVVRRQAVHRAVW